MEGLLHCRFHITVDPTSIYNEVKQTTDYLLYVCSNLKRDRKILKKSIKRKEKHDYKECETAFLLHNTVLKVCRANLTKKNVRKRITTHDIRKCELPQSSPK